MAWQQEKKRKELTRKEHKSAAQRKKFITKA